MRKAIRKLSLICAILIVCTMPVSAEESNTYTNRFISSFNSFITVPSGNTLNIWFDVVGCGAMDEIGVECIELDRSSNRTDWTTIRVFYPEDYPQMVRTNTGINCNYVSCNVTGGFFYRAYVVFYAQDSRGMGIEYDYTNTMYMPRPSEPINSVVDTPVLG